MLSKILVVCILLFPLSSSAQLQKKYDKLVDSLTHAGKRSELIPYFQKELMLRPKNEEALRWLGFLSLENNQSAAGEKYYRDAIAVDPTCAMCYFHIGRAFLIRKDTLKAVDMFNRSVSIDPNDARLYSNRAKLRQLINDGNGALLDYGKAIRLSPTNADYLIDRGIYYSLTGDHWLALADMSKAIELAPTNYNTWYQRGRVYYTQNMMKEALDDFNSCISIDSTQEELYIGRGVIYAGSKDYQHALKDYTKAISLSPASYIGYYNRALTNYSLENMDAYCDDIKQTYSLLKNEDPNNELMPELEADMQGYCNKEKPAFYYQRGIALYNVEKYEKAVDIYSEGLQKFPGNVMTQSFRGNAYYRLDEHKKALADYTATLANRQRYMTELKASNNFANMSADSLLVYENTFWADTYSSIAKCKFGLRMYIEALADINTAINTATSISEKYLFYNVRGNILLAMEKYQDAFDDFDKSIQLEPSFPTAYINRALARLAKASQINMQSVAINATLNSQGFNSSWTITMKPKKRSDIELAAALADCDKSIHLFPGLPAAYYVRGLIKKTLNYPGYCYDLLTANNNKYIVEPELLKDCR